MAYGFDEDKTKVSIEETVEEEAAGKVDSVAGKGLSTNNFTTTAKNIVNGLPTALAGKVDKVTGKGLSTNDFTNSLKTKTEEASYNTFSGFETLSSSSENYYSASNPFICPHDGYVNLRQPSAVYGAQPIAVLNILVNPFWLSVKSKYTISSNDVVFVKKGMKLYSTVSPLNTGASVTYYPMTSYT